jgi:8-oxo-dGTP diphosphatase
MIETYQGERALLDRVMKRPRVGVGVIVLRGGRKVLMGRRKGSHGAGTWSFPGGHLEPGETPESAAYRELQEETGMLSTGLHDLHWATNDVMEDEGKHYVTLFVRAEVDPGDEPILREPDRCEEWRWFDWDEMPESLFLPIRNLLDSGFRPVFP